MNRLLALVALIGLVLAAGVHVASLAGIDVSERIPLVWSLHLGVFVVFIPFVFSIRKVVGRQPTLSDIRQLVPRRVFLIGAAIGGYAILNFLLFMVATEGGNPSVLAGKYVLENHGHLVREITRAEYTAFRANDLRGFSGHWLVFYFVPFAYFMFANKPQPSLERTAPREVP